MSHPLANIEQDLFVEAIRRKYGYDFRHYAQSSLGRRMLIVQKSFGIKNKAEMISHVLQNQDIAYEFIKQMSIVYTNLFRDPDIYKDILHKIIPDLKTYPFLKIWHAGAATGEEVYSMAIFFKEHGLYDRAQFYATDYNRLALDEASQGVYKKSRFPSFVENYQLMGGKSSLKNYFDVDDKTIRIKEDIKKNVTFASHNLVTDGVFGEMNLIMCRNVLIYFDNILKNKVLDLFYDSLDHRGFLCVGKAEDMDEEYLKRKYSIVSNQSRLFRKQMQN